MKLPQIAFGVVIALGVMKVVNAIMHRGLAKSGPVIFSTIISLLIFWGIVLLYQSMSKADER